MTAAEAFERAREMIAEAIASGAERLAGFPEELEALPEEIRQARALRWLDITGTQVADLSPIAGMDWLTRLHAERTPIADLGPLEGLTGLASLSLNDTQVSDLSALRGAAGLQRLYLSNTQVSDLSALSGAAGLQKLSLKDTQVSDLSALSGAVVLRELSLNDTQVSDLSALSGAVGLQELWLNNTQVSDLSALSDAAGLQALYLNGTPVSDLSALSGAARLRELSLSHTQVRDLRPIRDASIDDDWQGVLQLNFVGIPATALDPELERLSLMHEHEGRSVQTLAYLRGLEEWPPKGTGPQEDRASGASFGFDPQGRFSLEDAALGSDEERAELQEDCRIKVRTLVAAVGDSNEYAGLKVAAERYRAVIDRAPEEIKARRLFSTGNTLKGWWQRHVQADREGPGERSGAAGDGGATQGSGGDAGALRVGSAGDGRGSAQGAELHLRRMGCGSL